MRRFALVLVCATALLATACSSGQPAGGSASNTSSTITRVGVSTAAPPTATLTFDWLGGNSKIIRVYPGAANTAADEVSDGTFASGQAAVIICKTLGRWVKSIPPEKKRRSNVWYEIEAGGRTYYATAVYGDVYGGPISWCPGL